MAEQSKKIEAPSTLIDEAYACLDQSDTKKAQKLGKQLVAIGHPAGYEILALCFLEKEEPKKALEALEKGVKAMPEAWPLWRQLGNLYSDQKEYELARHNHHKALACPGVDRALLNFDCALVLYREGRHPEALAVLQNLPPEWTTRSAPLKSSVLNGLERYDETVDLCRRITDHALDCLEQSELNHADISCLFTEMALAMSAKGNSADALEHLKTAVSLETTPFNLEKLREVNNQRSEKAKHYSLTVGGKWHQPIVGSDYLPEFLRVFQVVADSPEEALAFAKNCAPKGIADSLRIDECKENEVHPTSLKGVYEAWGYVFLEKE